MSWLFCAHSFRCFTALLVVTSALLNISLVSCLADELPKDAQLVIAENEKAVAEIQKKADEQIKAANDQFKVQLEKLQTVYTQAGKLDEAVAIRDYLKNAQGTKALKGMPDPGTLTLYRSEVGKVMFIEVVGSSTGSIYGTDVYTHDSYLAAAAVHAGVLKVGEKGIVKVTIVPAQTSFASTGRYGVSSTSWSSSTGYDCYKVESIKPSDSQSAKIKPLDNGDVRPDPGDLKGYRDQVGQSFLFEVTGGGDLWVYGSEIYSDDSPLATAAVHAGLVAAGKKAAVRVTILGPQAKFESVARNGITSRSWGAYDGSYKIEAVKAEPKK